MDTLEEAARRVAAGDGAAFRTIVLATSDVLVRLAARLLGSLPDAEDVVQEAFVKAHQALSTGKFDARSSVTTWLYRIVTHASIDALRARGRRSSRRDELDQLADPAFDGVASAEARVALRELSEVLEGLPAEQRAAVVLKVVEGLTTPEIASILSCTEGAVEQRLVRARAALRAKEAS